MALNVTKSKSNWKLSEFVAHGSNVNCLCLSPNNGHMLATGGDDRKVNLWLVGKPNNILSITGMTAPIQSVAFNNSETWLGSGTKSGILRVYDMAANKTVRSLSGHKAAIWSLDFHGYGDILASGSMDTNVKLWDIRRKGCIFAYKGHTEVVKDLKFSPDGHWVASGSGDGTVKVWDLVAGRMIADFKEHSKAVTTIQFHPREFLMSSGGMDRTVKFYDVEQFKMVSETAPDANGVSKILFHPDGNNLFTGTEESLKIHGWEPVRTYDTLPMHWGKVLDMTVSREKLIAASCSQTNVTVWCIDLKNVRPFSGDSSTLPDDQPVEPRPLSTSSRRLFEYKKQEIPSSAPAPPSGGVAKNGSSGSNKSPRRDSGGSSGSGNSSTDEEGSPPTQLKDHERKEIFAARQKLIHTPPKELPLPSALTPLPVSTSPPRSHASHTPHSPTHPAPSKLGKVQRIPPFVLPSAETRDPGHQQENRPPKSDISDQHLNGIEGQQNGGLPARKLHQPDEPIKPVYPVHIDQPTALPPSSVSNPALGPTPNKQPLEEPMQRLILKDFAPPAPTESREHSRSREASEIITNHIDVCQILQSRLQSLKEIRTQWSIEDPRVSLEMAVNCQNVSVLVDVLNVLHLKRTLWTLDMALIVLPELKLLIKSKYTLYVCCGCNVIKLVLKSFGPVIKSNLSSPPQGARDIQRDQRYEKCLSCHAHLSSLKEEVGKIVRTAPASPVGKVIRERALMAAFAALD